MTRDLTDQEWFVVQRLRQVAANKADHRGHGTLRVEITDGQPSLVKWEFSEKVPR